MSMRDAATRRRPVAGEAPRKLTRAEKSQKIKRDLLAAAAKVVGKVGYSNAQVSRITAVASVSSTPSLVVVNRRGQAEVLDGYNDYQTINQFVSNASRRK